MSYFLCIAVPNQAVPDFHSAFDPRVRHSEVTTFPIGLATCGHRGSWSAFVLQAGTSSASLVGKASTRRTHNNDHTTLLADGITALLSSPHCDQLSLLLHWMSGDIAAEDVPVKAEEMVRLDDLIATVASMQEDIRYTVVR